jgi:hypothetical protein
VGCSLLGANNHPEIGNLSSGDFGERAVKFPEGGSFLLGC